MEFYMKIVIFISMISLLLGCSHREVHDCCKADFANNKEFKVQAKHIWKKEF